MSSINEFTYNASGIENIHAWSFIPASSIAVLHIVHGMMEHSGRYKGFAEWMSGNGIATYASDLPGHGLSVKDPEELGHLDETTGWNDILQAVSALQQRIHEEQAGLPVFLLGHSFGSVVVRSFVQNKSPDHHPNAGLILSGSMQQPSALLKAGLWMIPFLKIRHDQHHRSQLMINLGYGQYAKFFSPNRTRFDWLTSVPETVDTYLDDPLCGYACTLGFYENFFKALLKTWKVSNIRKVPRELPVLFLGGNLDPSTRFGKDIRLLSEKYKRNGMENVRTKLYKMGRHEMLNEVNKLEVWQFVKDWMTSVLESRQ